MLRPSVTRCSLASTSTPSEDRAVLHAALRNFDDFKISEAGVDEVGKVLAHIKELTDSVRSGTWTGYTGKTINNIVNIPSWSLRR